MTKETTKGTKEFYAVDRETGALHVFYQAADRRIFCTWNNTRPIGAKEFARLNEKRYGGNVVDYVHQIGDDE